MNIELTAEQIAQANKPPDPQREVAQPLTTRRSAATTMIVDDLEVVERGLAINGVPGGHELNVSVGMESVRVDRASLLKAIGVFQ